MQDKQSQIQEIRKEKIQNLLQNAFNALKGILTTAFSGGEQKPTQALFHYNALFNLIWDEIMAAQVCTSLDELNAFFANVHQNIAQRIADYHANNRLTFAIPKTVEGIFQALVLCCQEMIQQKYLFFALDEASDIRDEIQTVKILMSELADDLQGAHQYAQEASLEQFIECLKMITTQLNACGYGTFALNLREENKCKQNYPSYIALGQQLRRLPTITALNTSIERLHQSLDNAPHAKIEAEREELRKRIVIIKEVRDKIFKTLNDALQQHDKTYTELTKTLQKISVTVKKLDAVYGRVEAQHRVFALLSPFGQMGSLVQACETYNNELSSSLMKRNKKQTKQEADIWVNATSDIVKLQKMDG